MNNFPFRTNCVHSIDIRVAKYLGRAIGFRTRFKLIDLEPFVRLHHLSPSQLVTCSWARVPISSERTLSYIFIVLWPMGFFLFRYWRSVVLRFLSSIIFSSYKYINIRAVFILLLYNFQQTFNIWLFIKMFHWKCFNFKNA